MRKINSPRRYLLPQPTPSNPTHLHSKCCINRSNSKGNTPKPPTGSPICKDKNKGNKDNTDGTFDPTDRKQRENLCARTRRNTTDARMVRPRRNQTKKTKRKNGDNVEHATKPGSRWKQSGNQRWLVSGFRSSLASPPSL